MLIDQFIAITPTIAATRDVIIFDQLEAVLGLSPRLHRMRRGVALLEHLEEKLSLVWYGPSRGWLL